MRTSEQALKDAIDSGAVQAWINGQPIMSKYRHSLDSFKAYPDNCKASPNFTSIDND